MTSTERLAGRRAIVTGSAAGIGRAIAIRLAAEGARVVLADNQVDRAGTAVAEITHAGGEALVVGCDVAEESSVSAMVAEGTGWLGGLDILVSNAGIPGKGLAVHELDVEDWDRVLGVNLRGVYLCGKHAIPHLLRSDHAAIVNTASTFGMVGAYGSAAYAASKGGVIALTRQMAVEYGPSGIRVNALAPGYVDNDMADRRTRMTPEAAAANLAAREAAAALQPAGRQGSTDEIAAAVAFLVSDDASFVTGTTMVVDGGCTAHFNYGSRQGSFGD